MSFFKSKVPQTIARSIAQAETIETQQRKIDANKLKDYFHGQALEDLKADLIQYSGNIEQLKPVCINIVKKIISRLAQVYQKPATRTVDGSDQDKELFSEIETASRLGLKMKQASRYTKLLKTCLVKVSYRNGKIALDILTPDLLDIETGKSPDDLKTVTITYYPASGNVRDTEYQRWTEGTFQILDYKGDVITAEPNPYGCPPFVALHDGLPLDDFFLPLPLDLISQQEAINLKLSDLLHVISLQSHGQPVSKGLPEKAMLKIGPNQAINLPADTRDKTHDFRFADTNAKIEETVTAIQALINWAYISHGLPASSISSDAKESSGVAKQVDNFELDEMRQDDRELFAGYEQALFNLIRIVNNTHSKKQLSESSTLQVDFAEVKPPISEKEQLEVWDQLMEMGLMSLVDVACRRNPDLSREDAEQLIFQVREDQRALGKDL